MASLNEAFAQTLAKFASKQSPARHLQNKYLHTQLPVGPKTVILEASIHLHEAWSVEASSGVYKKRCMCYFGTRHVLDQRCSVPISVFKSQQTPRPANGCPMLASPSSLWAKETAEAVVGRWCTRWGAGNCFLEEKQRE